ncbi:hypothetical protein P691DRAFT_776762 [Macrolepiota fuliginosa MF-IS2]|uniref:Uncharacterized protein n=1 Tax=Macrolepiota fuliginosa MF-IS2 TaxID=1400762 RepID=A0A9P5X815_9AGAR|nr:hypothetical protein P691DRAFT_776762 [Macrolepiota fuliginosa MF-IS2]
MGPHGQDDIYCIKNVLFNAYVGRATYDVPISSIQPIVGIRFDYTAHKKFEIKFVKGGERVTMSIDGAGVGECNNSVAAFVTPGTAGDEWIVQLAEKGGGVYLYRYTIALARSPHLVWTLNLATLPANQARKVFSLPEWPYL